MSHCEKVIPLALQVVDWISCGKIYGGCMHSQGSKIFSAAMYGLGVARVHRRISG